MSRVSIGPDLPKLEGFTTGLGTEEDGAVLLFLGTVRDRNRGRAVEGIEYEAYREMGEEVLEAIAEEVAERFGTDRTRIHHRVGRLGVGEVSTLIAVGAPHRDEAYRASRYIIEELKRRLPVWKKELYLDGRQEWAPGHEPGALSAEAPPPHGGGEEENGRRVKDASPGEREEG